jgi:hypothetical protein
MALSTKSLFETLSITLCYYMCRYADSGVLIIVMLNVVVLSVIMLYGVLLNVIYTECRIC